jgi:N-acetylglucosamine malate deacetylase 2
MSVETLARTVQRRCLATRIFQGLAATAAFWPEAATYTEWCLAPWLLDRYKKEEDTSIKALVVVAHPDDESECAAVLYRITHEFGGTVDQVFITDGAGGMQYTDLATAYYRLPLCRQERANSSLGRIRRREAVRASRILGVRTNYFFDQRDTGFTLDPRDGLEAWNIPSIRRDLLRLLQRESYDLVFTLLPEADSHGHHQAVTLLTLESVAEMPSAQRPAVFGVCSANTVGLRMSALYKSSPLLASTTTREPVWSFDRRTRLLRNPSLDYTIVANWVIAEHKSQGIFQMEFGRRIVEHFWLFEISGEQRRCVWSSLIREMDRQQGRAPVPVMAEAG